MFLSNSFIFSCISLLLLVTVATSDTKCEEKETSLISLDIAEDLISKAKELFPNCTDAVATNTSECSEKEKASAYLDLAKKLVKHARENYPTCTDPVTEEPITEYPVTTEPLTEAPVTKVYPRSRDCYEVLLNGQNITGIYTIWPNSSSLPNRSMEVLCDMDTDKGGWTVVQKRGDFTPQENFNRDWDVYKKGFGNLTKDFWLGNDNIFILSNQGKYKIRFDLESPDGSKAYAVYDTFFIEDEWSHFRLHISKYSGNAWDSMNYQNQQNFYTKDRDNSNSCVKNHGKGGWWYNYCATANLNGEYKPGVTGIDNGLINWSGGNTPLSLSATEIKIKPVSSVLLK